MVEPIPLHRHRLPVGLVEQRSARDAEDLALAEHYEAQAEALRSIVADRALLQSLFGPAGVA